MQNDTLSESPPRPRLIVLVGLPGSGKSTWAKQQGVAVISSDRIRYLLADDERDQNIHGDVFATLRYLLRRRFLLRRPLTIVDATNLSLRERRPYIKTAQLYDCQVEAVFFDTPVEVCKERNRSRERIVPDEAIDMMAERLRVPTIEEGFDVVMAYRSGPAIVGAPQPLSESPRYAGNQNQQRRHVGEGADSDAAIREEPGGVADDR
jgi:predicted kinase